jgi:hypothetical protein
MGAWTSDELERIGAAEELRLASLRRDGTLRGDRYPAHLQQRVGR